MNLKSTFIKKSIGYYKKIVLSTNGAETTRDPHKENFNPNLTLYTKINSKWIR